MAPDPGRSRVTMARMEDAGRIVTKVRRRLLRIRLVEQFQSSAALTLSVLVVAGAIGTFFAWRIAPFTALCAGLILALLFSIVRTLAHPLSRAQAASEADRILGTRERISTSLALSEGRASDPLGLAPSLSSEASLAVRGAELSRIGKELRPRLRRPALLALIAAVALFCLPLLPTRAIASPDGPPPGPEESRKVAEKLRVLEKKLLKKEHELSKVDRKKAREELKRLREEVAKLRGEKPRRSAATDRLKKLEREAKDHIRRAAGLKAMTQRDTDLAENQTLNELAQALKALEEADPQKVRARLSKLMDKLGNPENMNGLTPSELASMERSVRQLNDAMRSLSEKLGEESELRKYLEGLADSEALKKLSRALAELRQAMHDRGLTEEERKKLQEAMRGYRGLELSEEQIEEMLKALEELKKLIESGAEISQCAGGMGGLLIPGIGGGMFPGGIGLGGSALGQGMGLGSGAGTGQGDGTGGAGRGRGGRPGVTDDGTGTNPDLIPGTPGLAGQVTLIRTIRSLPNKDDDPEAYESLMREASLEAEEALRRGEIPRAYRGYVRRFFSGQKDE